MPNSLRKLERLITNLETQATGAPGIKTAVAQVRCLLGGDEVAVELALAAANLVKVSMDSNIQRYIEDAERGGKVMQAAMAGSKAAHGTPEERATKYVLYQQRVDLKHAAMPRIKTWRQLSDLVARECGCSGRTIRNHTTNPLKKVGKVGAVSHRLLIG